MVNALPPLVSRCSACLPRSFVRSLRLVTLLVVTAYLALAHQAAFAASLG